MFDYVTDIGLVWPKGRTYRKITDHIQIHHTVGDYSTPEKWRALHQKRISEDGWKGIEYSFGVNAQGVIFNGRGLEYQHGAVKNSETKDKNGIGAADRSVSITFIGDMRSEGFPTQAQMDAAVRLTKDVMETYGLKPAQVLGHKEIPLTNGGLYPTACPSMDMDAFRARLTAPAPEPEPEPAPDLPALYRYTGATFVNIRTGAGTQFESIGRLSRNERCIVLAQNGDWVEIVHHEKTPMLRGWCIDSFLSRA